MIHPNNLTNGEYEVTSLGKNVPQFQGGTLICSYECGEYRAILVKDPESSGPIKYPHVLIVYRAIDNTSPIMIIAAEQGTISPTLLEMLPEELKGGFVEDARKEVFIGVFDEKGHSKFSSSSDYAILEEFESKALLVMRNSLNLTCRIRVIDDTRRGRAFWNYGLLLYVIAAITLTGMLIFLISVLLYK
jgi:hypothetical protein